MLLKPSDTSSPPNLTTCLSGIKSRMFQSFLKFNYDKVKVIVFSPPNSLSCFGAGLGSLRINILNVLFINCWSTKSCPCLYLYLTSLRECTLLRYQLRLLNHLRLLLNSFLRQRSMITSPLCLPPYTGSLLNFKLIFKILFLTLMAWNDIAPIYISNFWTWRSNSFLSTWGAACPCFIGNSDLRFLFYFIFLISPLQFLFFKSPVYRW